MKITAALLATLLVTVFSNPVSAGPTDRERWVKAAQKLSIRSSNDLAKPRKPICMCTANNRIGSLNIKNPMAESEPVEMHCRYVEFLNGKWEDSIGCDDFMLLTK